MASYPRCAPSYPEVPPWIVLALRGARYLKPLVPKEWELNAPFPMGDLRITAISLLMATFPTYNPAHVEQEIAYVESVRDTSAEHEHRAYESATDIEHYYRSLDRIIKSTITKTKQLQNKDIINKVPTLAEMAYMTLWKRMPMKLRHKATEHGMDSVRNLALTLQDDRRPT